MEPWVYQPLPAIVVIPPGEIWTVSWCCVSKIAVITPLFWVVV